ncbi:hypothetical protein [Sanguibacter sp. Z1732]|uniref:hypothetical protein n=1 Tax=Sanguibacter sp. Z1732 TaxID=3435412 RepID=UPI003D9C9E52
MEPADGRGRAVDPADVDPVHLLPALHRSGHRDDGIEVSIEGVLTGERGPISGEATVTFGGQRAHLCAVMRPSLKDQDRAGAGQDCLVVADGVTPICPDDGAVVQDYAETVINAFLEQRQTELAEVLQNAVRQRPSTAGEAPACAVGAARAVRGVLELASVADVLAAAQCRDGRVVVCVDNRVEKHEVRAALAFYRSVLSGEHVDVARTEARKGLLAQRQRRNRTGSYWVMAGESAVAEEVKVIRLPLADVRTVLVASDGFTRAWQELGVLSGVAEALDPTVSLDQVADDIRTAERWRARSPLPLFGPSDDLTALRMTFD